jgi:hypothetical protein
VVDHEVSGRAIAVVRPLPVVEAHEALEGAIKRRPVGEVDPAEGHPPVFVQDDGLLKPLDEAVGPGVPGLGLGVAEAAGDVGSLLSSA